CFLRRPPALFTTLFPYTTLFRSNKEPFYDPDPEEPAPSVVPALLGDLSGLVFRAGLDHHRPHLYHPQPPGRPDPLQRVVHLPVLDRKSTRLNSSHVSISYAVFCL